jgi:tRNA U34 5-methylaminomethyl-2-thiouridine-forming methyltransferase MnmC
MNETLITGDGSATIFKAELNESYHSRHGALTESRHVFIEAGLKEAFIRFGLKLNILEIGFGTGLNALLTLQECRKHKMEVWYTAIENSPIAPDLLQSLQYANASGYPEDEKLF